MPRNSNVAQLRGRAFSVAEEYIDDEQSGADSDGGISDVECGIVIAAEPHFKKIGDRSMEDAIGYVAGRAAEKKCEARGAEAAATLDGDEEPSEQDNDHDGAGNENDTRPGRRGIREKTKSDAGIAGANEIEKMTDHFVAPAFGGLRFEPRFRRAVEQNDGEREPEPAKSCGKIHKPNEARETKQTKELGAVNILGHRHAGGAVALDFAEGFGAAFADGWVTRILADMRRIIPAAVTLFSVGALDLDRKAG